MKERYFVVRSAECWKVFSFLADKEPMPLWKIAKKMNKKQSTISDQLNALYRNGLLKKRKKGKEVLYEVNWDGFREHIIDMAIGAINRCIEDRAFYGAVFKFRSRDKDRIKKYSERLFTDELLKQYIVNVRDLPESGYIRNIESVVSGFWISIYRILSNEDQINSKVKKYFDEKSSELFIKVGEFIEISKIREIEASLILAINEVIDKNKKTK